MPRDYVCGEMGLETAFVIIGLANSVLEETD